MGTCLRLGPVPQKVCSTPGWRWTKQRPFPWLGLSLAPSIEHLCPAMHMYIAFGCIYHSLWNCIAFRPEEVTSEDFEKLCSAVLTWRDRSPCQRAFCLKAAVALPFFAVFVANQQTCRRSQELVTLRAFMLFANVLFTGSSKLHLHRQVCEAFHKVWHRQQRCSGHPRVGVGSSAQNSRIHPF